MASRSLTSARAYDQWSQNYNERNLIENGFLNEFAGDGQLTANNARRRAA